MPAGTEDVADLAVRPPQQRRSREGWVRILDAGVALLQLGGYEAFTIAAVCERAQVPPRAIYARTGSKDALFLAVYEHGMGRVLADQQAFADPGRWAELEDRQLVHAAVEALSGIFVAHADFLRAVVLVSGVHPEVSKRGMLYVGQLADAFAAVVMPRVLATRPVDGEIAVRVGFSAVFSTLVMRTAYGPGFTGQGMADGPLVEQLGDLVADHVLGTEAGPPA